MSLSKKKKGIIFAVTIILVILGGGGIFGGLYYNAVSQIEVDIDHVYITGFSEGGTFLNRTIDVDLEIHASISNPTSIAVEVDYAQFELYFDGVYSGEGQTSSFAATKTPSPMIIDVLLDDISGEQYLLLADLIFFGNSKVATVRITSVMIWGIAVEINTDINVTVTSSDIF
ncbi:hypothetical protein DSAG12_01324 [Promethearchaeum syntrophicum]|uniref:Late embryogenesis abundant protein n=1 Tax=Promethearchaeum syntrophicum TaxID=2594042 RepID=A0A5B9D8C4_9ARCH|nr:hypothetical protein [Candidatus Prometheoarchaeum syntrophicum]QEE15498.1 hypothetical protein DSAG12_01324 [Candidatus Prometheoarchaeum syntrophicum]